MKLNEVVSKITQKLEGKNVEVQGAVVEGLVHEESGVVKTFRINLSDVDGYGEDVVFDPEVEAAAMRNREAFLAGQDVAQAGQTLAEAAK